MGCGSFFLVGSEAGAGRQSSRPLTWLGHRPLLALKQVAGCRQLTDPCPVYSSGPELIEVAFMKIADLMGGKGQAVKEAGAGEAKGKCHRGGALSRAV
jgi:hypothetical protein